MACLATQFWTDERGVILSAEIVVVMTLGILSLVVGLQALSQAVVCELSDVANAFSHLRQSYYFTGFSGFSGYGAKLKSHVEGSAFSDVARDHQISIVAADVGCVFTEEAVVPCQLPIEPAIEEPCVPANVVEPSPLHEHVTDVDCERLKNLVRQLCEEISREKATTLKQPSTSSQNEEPASAKTLPIEVEKRQIKPTEELLELPPAPPIQ